MGGERTQSDPFGLPSEMMARRRLSGYRQVQSLKRLYAEVPIDVLRLRFLFLTLTLGAFFLVLGSPARTALAHGFGERYDLPLPLSYFVVGGAAAVALSFVVVGLFVRGEHGGSSYPRLNLFRFTPLRVIMTGPLTWALRVASLLLFFLIIATGIFGSQRVGNNLTPVFVWIVWWVGMGFVVSLLGNLWAVVNPWKILFGFAEGIYHRFNPQWELTLGLDYPEWIGVWPSVGLFFAFVWVENALPVAASPALLAWLIIGYSLFTLTGMYLFGKHQWLRHAEVFTVVYGFLARFSVTEAWVNAPGVCSECSEPTCRDRQGDDDSGCVDCFECFEHSDDVELNLRPPAIGLHIRGAMPAGITAMILLVLSTVTFDGFSDTPEWTAVLGWMLTQTAELTSPYFNGLVIANTLGLALFPLAFAGIYWLFSALMMRFVLAGGGAGPTTSGLMTAFVLSLVPIALAYHFAHYLGFLLIQGQAVIPLVSDPFGSRANLFGTAGYMVNIGVTNARFIWFFSVVSIVVGHIIAVYLAHLRATSIYGNGRLAFRSQIPMLGLMVIYTVLSLWIISRPITE